MILKEMKYSRIGQIIRMEKVDQLKNNGMEVK